MKIYLALSTVLLVLVQISPSSGNPIKKNPNFAAGDPPDIFAENFDTDEPPESNPPQGKKSQYYDVYAHLMEPIEESQWPDDCLGAHNYFRSLYVDARTNKSLTQLTWNNNLANSAKNWARELIARKPGKDQIFDTSDHKPDNPHGENFFAIEGYPWRSNWRCAAGIRRYHEEKEYYDEVIKEFHKKPENKGKYWKFRAGASWAHYTQLLWIETTTVGCGYADNEEKRIEVCHYSVPGNRPSEDYEVRKKRTMKSD